MSMLSRRQLLRWGAAVVAPAVTGTAIGLRLAADVRHRSPAVPRFRVPLPIPPVLRPVTGDHYEIEQVEADAEILPGRPTRILGYNGIFPGPTIEARRGRPVTVRHVNRLRVPTVVHLHGGVVPAESDGYPADLVLPAGVHHWPGHHQGEVTHGSRLYRYPNDQPAAALWYHDHRMDFTGPQVYRGLAGLYLIRDETEDGLPLPRGDREIPLVITDRFFEEDGSFHYPSLDPSLRGRPGVKAVFMDGVRGDTVLVNGAPWPVKQVGGARHRLRLLNASNARSYELRLNPPAPLVLIGGDAGLLERPVTLDKIIISPGERYDVIVDFAHYRPGTQVVLVNGFDAGGPAGQIMRFDVDGPVADDSEIPPVLAPALGEPGDPVATRAFSFLGGQGGLPATINSRTFRLDRVDARPRRNTTEHWVVSGDPEHPIHVHLAQFKVLKRNGGPPDPQDAGWKDTVLLRGGSVRLAVRFGGHPGRYVVHCHNLEHEDMMMMTNIEVV